MSMLTPLGVGGRGKVRRRGRSRHVGRNVFLVLVVLGAAAAGTGWWLSSDTGTTAAAPRPT